MKGEGKHIERGAREGRKEGEIEEGGCEEKEKGKGKEDWGEEEVGVGNEEGAPMLVEEELMETVAEGVLAEVTWESWEIKSLEGVIGEELEDG